MFFWLSVLTAILGVAYNFRLWTKIPGNGIGALAYFAQGLLFLTFLFGLFLGAFLWG